MSIHHHENGADNETPGNLVICQDNTIHREGNNVTEKKFTFRAELTRKPRQRSFPC